MTPLGRGGLNEIVHQLQSVFFVPQVAEWIVSVGLLQIHKVQHPDIVPLAFEVAACSSQHLLR